VPDDTGLLLWSEKLNEGFLVSIIAEDADSAPVFFLTLGGGEGDDGEEMTLDVF
jgi:hypothetical protein